MMNQLSIHRNSIEIPSIVRSFHSTPRQPDSFEGLRRELSGAIADVAAAGAEQEGGFAAARTALGQAFSSGGGGGGGEAVTGAFAGMLDASRQQWEAGDAGVQFFHQVGVGGWQQW